MKTKKFKSCISGCFRMQAFLFLIQNALDDNDEEKLKTHLVIKTRLNV